MIGITLEFIVGVFLLLGLLVGGGFWLFLTILSALSSYNRINDNAQHSFENMEEGGYCKALPMDPKLPRLLLALSASLIFFPASYLANLLLGYIVFLSDAQLTSIETYTISFIATFVVLCTLLFFKARSMVKPE